MRIFNKKNIHLAIAHPLWVKLKIAAFQRMLSTNELLNGLVWLYATEDRNAVAVMDKLARMKYEGSLYQNISDSVQHARVEFSSMYDFLESLDEQKDEE